MKNFLASINFQNLLLLLVFFFFLEIKFHSRKLKRVMNFTIIVKSLISVRFICSLTISFIIQFSFFILLNSQWKKLYEIKLCFVSCVSFIYFFKLWESWIFPESIFHTKKTGQKQRREIEGEINSFGTWVWNEIRLKLKNSLIKELISQYQKRFYVWSNETHFTLNKPLYCNIL